MSKPALGRGLGALLGGAKPAVSTAVPQAPAAAAPEAVAPGSQAVRRVPRSLIRPSPLQPRKDFPPGSLTELADSIREQGIIQPLVVRPAGDGYELIAGERRWRAAELAGIAEVPVIERAATDLEVLELALIENLQRENLNPVEEALGYRELQTRFALTQEEVARKVGRGRVAVANATRLLRLPDAVLALLREGGLSVGHAKAILVLEDGPRQEALARRIVSEGLTVRQAERLAAAPPASPAPAAKPAPSAAGRDLHVVDLENRIRERFGMKVALRYRAGKGSLEVRFGSDDELGRVLEVLGVVAD